MSDRMKERLMIALLEQCLLAGDDMSHGVYVAGLITEIPHTVSARVAMESNAFPAVRTAESVDNLYEWFDAQGLKPDVNPCSLAQQAVERIDAYKFDMHLGCALAYYRRCPDGVSDEDFQRLLMMIERHRGEVHQVKDRAEACLVVLTTTRNPEALDKLIEVIGQLPEKDRVKMLINAASELNIQFPSKERS